MMKFCCPYCDGHITAGPEDYGSRAPCPHCEKEIVVPEIIETTPVIYPATREPERTPAAEPAPEPVPAPMQAQVVYPAKNRGIYIILGLFLGGLFGVHNFYAGYYVQATCQLLITVVLGWLIIPLLIVGVWVLIDVVCVRTDARGVAMG